jgi:hypothetical protein
MNSTENLADMPDPICFENRPTGKLAQMLKIRGEAVELSAVG